MFDQRLPNVATATFNFCAKPLDPDLSGLDPGFSGLINRYAKPHYGFAWVDCCNGNGLKVFSRVLSV